MAQRRRRRLRQRTHIDLADSDFTRANRPPWVASATDTGGLKHWRHPDGPLFQIIHSKNFYYFSSSNYRNFRALHGHSSIGLDDNSMLLLGGKIGDTYHADIWQIKENVWSRIGELTQVWDVIILWLICIISECRLWIGVLHWPVHIFFRWKQLALSKSSDWFDAQRRDQRSPSNWESWKRVQLSFPFPDYSRLLRLKTFIHYGPD